MTSLKSSFLHYGILFRTDQTRYTDGQWQFLGVDLEVPFSIFGWIAQDLAISNYQALIAYGDAIAS